jgi:hypothetical protein
MKKVEIFFKHKRASSFPYTWCTYVSEKNRTSLDLQKPLCKLKPKQNLISNDVSMWLTHACEKNETLFEPPQPPCKLNQNKSFVAKGRGRTENFPLE